MRNLVAICVAILGLLLASAALALVSQDTATPEADTHQLEWRAFPSDPWMPVGSPQAVTDVTHSSITGSFRGVDWDTVGINGFGEFRARATSPSGTSPYSDVINLGGPPPPTAPVLLSTFVVLVALKRCALPFGLPCELRR